MEVDLIKQCVRCHVEKPIDEFGKNARNKDGKMSCCKACARSASSAYRDENREKCRASVRASTARKKSGKKWRSDAEVQAEQAKRLLPRGLIVTKVCPKCDSLRRLATEFHRNNGVRSGFNGVCKFCNNHKPVGRKRNPEWQREYDKTYRIKNRNKRRGYARKRRAQKAKLPHEEYSATQVILRDGDTCWLCGKIPTEDEFTIEHYIALLAKEEDLILWGIDNPGNVLANASVACRSCNSRKTNKFMLCAALRYMRNLDTPPATE